MRENDAFIGQVENYLVEFDGETPLPRRVADAIHAELPRTRQVQPHPGSMRMLPMMSTLLSRAPLGIAAAVIILAVVVGASYMSNNDQTGVGGAPAAGPSASSSRTLLVDAPSAACPGITDAKMCLE